MALLRHFWALGDAGFVASDSAERFCAFFAQNHQEDGGREGLPFWLSPSLLPQMAESFRWFGGGVLVVLS